ncbi:MAG: ABC transporter ATP-binding protein [Bacteroidota bacterium]
MSNVVIHIEGLGKQYRQGHQSGNLRDWLRQRFTTQKAAYFWALQHINLRVEQGEILGIIGRNGSGKSTLLKILSRITPPTVGRAVLRGKVASLLEVGTGFHPELTGRENIYLNGAILGMSREEVRRSLAEIVDFAGVENFIDAKVKAYSSGMYVRLAFSVAAHLRTDILLVDEVLAVGDAEFQKKSLGKMNDVVRDSGRTILFVSHNLGLVNKLCSRAICLNEGEIYKKGSTGNVLGAYQDLISTFSLQSTHLVGPLASLVHRVSIQMNGQEMGSITHISLQDQLVFSILFEHDILLPIKFHLALFRDGIRLCTVQDSELYQVAPSKIRSVFKFAAGQFRPGNYQLGIGGLAVHDKGEWFWAEDVASFTVLEDWPDANAPINYGWFSPQAWSTRQLPEHE